MADLWKWFEEIYGREAALVGMAAWVGWKAWVEFRNRPKSSASPLDAIDIKISRHATDLSTLDDRLHEAEKQIAVLNERTAK